jgi:UDP-2-acetamido-2,6-beta-L-arabino-hexul-4-ose reductase
MNPTVLITGADGFIGTNLRVRLNAIEGVKVLRFVRGDSVETLAADVARADVVYHLAGVNRPADPAEFEAVNHGLTTALVEQLGRRESPPTVVLASSTQASLDNPYGRSKHAAEQALLDYAGRELAPVAVYRLPGVFGKWSRPDYNTVVATFCRNAAEGVPLRVDDPDRELELVHIDDVVEELIGYATGERAGSSVPEIRSVGPRFSIRLGELAALIERLAALRRGSVAPDVGDPLTKHLHAMLLTFLEPPALVVPMDKKTDQRGHLFELLKTDRAGQVFMSVTHPGVTRGNHYHHDKVERFFVVSGEARITMRHMVTNEVSEFLVRGEDCQAVDIPAGSTHAITNVGDEDMVVLFWASEIFDPERPDTYFEAV